MTVRPMRLSGVIGRGGFRADVNRLGRRGDVENAQAGVFLQRRLQARDTATLAKLEKWATREWDDMMSDKPFRLSLAPDGFPLS